MLGLGLIEPAIQALQRATAGPTRDPGAHHSNLGRALVIAGRPEEALPHLRTGLELATHDHSLALRSLTEALGALGRTDEALALLPDDFAQEEAVVTRVRLLAAAARHDEAANYLRGALRHCPNATGLLRLAADLAEVRGRDGEAVALVRRALDKEPESVALWARLAQMGRKGALHGAAREAADQALRLARGGNPPTLAMALAADAHVKSECGDVTGAEAAWREALRLSPGFVPALSGLGHLLMQQGHVEDAVSYFKQVQAAAPLQGWAQLIHAREVPEDDSVLERMESAARQPGLEGPMRAGLLFTTSAAWDRKKAYGRAFQAAHDANEASKHHLTYRPEQHRAKVDEIMARYSREFMASRAGWGHPTRAPVFVLGMPRSGTTLCEQILAGHSAVFGAGELGQIPEQIGNLVAWEQKLGSGLTYPGCITELTREECQGIAARLLAQLQQMGPGAPHIIDKLPHNFENIGLIKLLFPNATIFHCRREPRDIAVSNYMTDYAAKFGGMGFAYDLGWIGEQLVDHDRLMRHWHEVFPGQIFEVVYEELVEDTEGWARRMLAHLGLPWEPQVLEFQSLERPVKTASVWQVRQPVYKTSKARWKRYEAHLGPLEEALARVPPMPAALPLPTLPAGLYAEGMRHLAQGEPAQAQACFEQVLAANPRHAAANQFLGAALLQLGRAPEAVVAMRRSVRLRPGHASWFENLAVAEGAAGYAQAEQQAREMASRLRAEGSRAA